MTAKQPEVEATNRYTLRETAQYLDRSIRTVQRYINAGTITVHYRKANKRPYITGLEIMKVWNQTF